MVWSTLILLDERKPRWSKQIRVSLEGVRE